MGDTPFSANLASSKDLSVNKENSSGGVSRNKYIYMARSKS